MTMGGCGETVTGAQRNKGHGFRGAGGWRSLLAGGRNIK